MTVATRAVATAALAALVAVAGFVGIWPLAALAALIAVALGAGWPLLTGLPFAPGSAVVVALAGFGAVVAAALTPERPGLRDAAIVFALAVVLAFVNELLRRDGRVHLVESVSGTVTGALLAVTASGWVAAVRAPDGEDLVVAGAAALAVAAVVTAVRMPVWLRSAATIAAATLTAVILGAVLPRFGLVAGLVLGFGIGVLVAALHALFHPLPALERRLPALAALVLPVAVTGMLVYVVGRVLLG